MILKHLLWVSLDLYPASRVHVGFHVQALTSRDLSYSSVKHADEYTTLFWAMRSSIGISSLYFLYPRSELKRFNWFNNPASAKPRCCVQAYDLIPTGRACVRVGACVPSRFVMCSERRHKRGCYFWKWSCVNLHHIVNGRVLIIYHF